MKLCIVLFFIIFSFCATCQASNSIFVSYPAKIAFTSSQKKETKIEKLKNKLEKKLREKLQKRMAKPKELQPGFAFVLLMLLAGFAGWGMMYLVSLMLGGIMSFWFAAIAGFSVGVLLFLLILGLVVG